MSKKAIIIQGSSRVTGNTRTLVDCFNSSHGFEIIDLATLNIGQFDYEFRNRDDDFLPTIRHAIRDHDTIVFATPVYWYAMSGLLKAFFDRLTDLLSADKDLGRELRGMNMAMISCGSDENVPAGFSEPFVESAGYLGMNYIGDVHGWLNGEMTEEIRFRIDEFSKKFQIN